MAAKNRKSLNILVLIAMLLAAAFLVNGYAQCPVPASSTPENASIASMSLSTSASDSTSLNTSNETTVASEKLESNAPTYENDTLTYENSTYGFRMKYPSSWIMQEPDPNNMNIVVGFLAPGEDMKNPTDYVMVQVENLPVKPVITLDQYAQAVMTNLKKVYTNYQIISAKNRQISGLPGKELSYNMTSSDSNYRNLLAITLKDNKAYTITLVSLSDKYLQFESAANTIINSFEFAEIQAQIPGIGGMAGIPLQTH